MLSRLALRPGQLTLLSRMLPIQARVCHHVAKNEDNAVLKIKEGPERDLVNFPRRLRPFYPGKVRMGFIPEEWFEFFYKKTGVTGPYLFGVGFSTFLISKEYLVLEHEFYNGVGLVIFCYLLIKKLGPTVSEYLEKETIAVEDNWKKFRTNSIDGYKNAIAQEEKEQWCLQGQKHLFDAKRENVNLQLEASYRERLMTVYSEVKRRLDYQLELQSASRRIEQLHMVKWITDNVVKSITPQQEKEALQHCVTTLKSLAAK